MTNIQVQSRLIVILISFETVLKTKRRHLAD